LTPHARPVVRLAAAAIGVFAVSCSGGSGKLYPVTGQVFYLDRPAEGALVVFQPINAGPDAPMPTGKVGADGSFKLSTLDRGEGAPAGDYIVLVTWFPPDAREQTNPRNQLPERYGSPTDSPLRATVNKGPTELEPFRLTKK
jgi:hypothetical protein